MAPTTDNPNDYPERKPIDTITDVTKAIAGSAFPGAQALTQLIKTSHDRRMETFLRRISDRLNELEQTSAPVAASKGNGRR